MAKCARHGSWLVRIGAWCLILLAMENIGSATSRPSLAAALKDDEATCSSMGTCELDLKLLIAAGKKLIAEAETLTEKPDEAMGIQELSRVWRLVRNQQNLVHEAFQNLNSKFSNTIRSASGIVTIRTEEASDLTDLFYGGEPFMVQCVSPTDSVNRVFVEAADGLSSAGVTPAALDCNAQLPSGKTTFERFFEGKSHEEPFFFYTANRMKPRSFTLKPHVTADMLVSFSLNATKPKFTKVTSQEDLREDCLRRKMCAVVVHNNSITEEERAVAEAVLLKKRSVAMVEVDLSKLQFSLEDALPPAKSIPRLVYLQVGSAEKDKKDKPKVEGKAYKGEEWSTKSLVNFLEDVQTGVTKLSKLKTSPSVTERKSGKEKEKKKDKPAKKEERPPAKSTKTKTGTGGGFKNTVEVDKNGKQKKSFGDKKKVTKQERAQMEAEERERERRRREEMAREAEAADGIEFVGEDPDEEEGRRIEDDDEYDEEHIEVDDDWEEGEDERRGGAGPEDTGDDDSEEEEEEAIKAKDAGKEKGKGKGREGWLW